MVCARGENWRHKKDDVWHHAHLCNCFFREFVYVFSVLHHSTFVSSSDTVSVDSVLTLYSVWYGKQKFRVSKED
jgi:hypothetical protein